MSPPSYRQNIMHPVVRTVVDELQYVWRCISGGDSRSAACQWMSYSMSGGVYQVVTREVLPADSI